MDRPGPVGGETIGNNNNRGCRLTQAEIDAFRAQLISNRKAFSPSLIVMWSVQDQQVINDPGIPPLPFQDRKREFANFLQQVVSQNWDNDFLNIYFCGNVEYNEGFVFGLTSDPSQVSETPLIIINDGGGRSSSGHASPIGRLTLEHELAHYLLRRANQPPYDQPPLPAGGEHVPNGSMNILTVGLPRVMVVPSSELAEISARVRNGTWNLP